MSENIIKKNNNLPMKTINYGMTEHILYYEINQEHYDHYTWRDFRQMLNKYLVEINKNKKLIELITRYKDRFEFFITEHEEKIEKTLKRNDSYTKISFVVKYYKIKQSFLSYLIQNKNKLYEVIVNKEYIKIKTFVIRDVSEKLSEFVYFDKEKRLRNINKKYDAVQLYYYKTKKSVDFDIKIKNDMFHIKNKIYKYDYIKNTDRLLLYNNKIKMAYEYDLLLRESQTFFEKVNINNDSDWDEYLTQEVRKLMMFDTKQFHEDLKKETLEDLQKSKNK